MEDDPGAPYLNDTQKFVVGTDVPVDLWGNSVSLGPSDPHVVRRLKTVRPAVIYVSGSGQLVRALLAEGLVDELHLFVYPITLGSGAKFWGRLPPTRLALTAYDGYAQRGRPFLQPAGEAARRVTAGRTLSA